MADGEGSIEEGTYPKQKSKSSGNNGGILDEMCTSAGKNGKKMKMAKEKGRAMSWQQNG